ncbi:MAG: hypothetical protein R6U98_06135, partial [Pirellulaceae bacterium]
MTDNELQTRLGSEANMYFTPQHDRCRYKDVDFSFPANNHYAVAWYWQFHKEYSPSDLAASLHYDPDVPKDIADRAVRLRLAYPDPAPNTNPSHNTWYPQSAEQYSICDDLEGFNTPATSDLEECFCAPIWFRWEQPPIKIIEDMYYRNDRLKDPGAWGILRDPVTAELAVLTLNTGRLVPSTLKKAITSTGAPFTDIGDQLIAARVDTTQFGLSHPHEKVLFTYLPQGASGDVYQPPQIYMGLVSREENQWLSWKELFGPEAVVPAVEDAKMVFDERNDRLVLLGTTTDASGM